jgi:lipopolysaccharide transport system ATP-binding protein
MSNVAISVENLSKSYRIAHQANGARYKTLREDLMQMPKRILSRFQRFSSPLSSSETFWALKDVSFEVKQGEVVGIIGRNGAGKSTLLKILSRITEPTSGQAKIYGRVGSLLEVGTGFHPELTGRENIFLNGAILGMSRAEIRARFDEIVAFAEIEKFLDTPVKRYSSGMYVRLAFAVAAHLDPEILLVDEVLAVGDAEFQKKCLGKMGEVAKGGRTVLFVSHNLTAVRHLCSTGIALEDGSILHIGPTENVIDAYARSLTNGKQTLRNSQRLSIQKAVFSGADQHGSLLRVNASKPLRCSLDLFAAYEPDRAWLNLEIFSSDGIRLVHIRNDFDAVDLKLKKGIMNAEIVLHSLPLLPDSYTLLCRLVADKDGQREIFESESYLLEIEGIKPGKGTFQAFVNVSHGWSLRHLEPS